MQCVSVTNTGVIEACIYVCVCVVCMKERREGKEENEKKSEKESGKRKKRRGSKIEMERRMMQKR